MTNARREIRVIEEAEQDEAASIPSPQTKQDEAQPPDLAADMASGPVDAFADQQDAPGEESSIAMPFTTDGFRDIDTESYLAGSNLGVALRQARLKHKLSLEDVAGILHIRKEYLQAIEQGNYRSLPGRTYAIGFVRTYASHLGLDPLDAIQRFKNETEAPESSLTFPKVNPEKRLPGAAIVVGSIVAIGVLYGAWYFYSADDTAAPAETASAETAAAKPAKAAAEPKETASAAERAAPATAAGATTDGAASSGSDQADASQAARSDTAANETAQPAPAESEPVAAAEQPAPAEQSAPTSEAAVAGDAGPAEQPTAVRETAPVAEEAVVAEEAAVAEEAVAADTGRVEVSVKTGSWIQIRNAEGAVVFTKLLRPGEIYKVPPDKTGFTLLTGDAGALEIRVDGEVLPALGSPGQVRRNIPLDAEKLLSDAGTSN